MHKIIKCCLLPSCLLISGPTLGGENPDDGKQASKVFPLPEILVTEKKVDAPTDEKKADAAVAGQ